MMFIRPNERVTLNFHRILLSVHRCELCLARMKISNYAPYAEERFETARQHQILHPERIIGNSELSRNGFEEVGRISTGKSACVYRRFGRIQSVIVVVLRCTNYNPRSPLLGSKKHGR